MKLILLMFVLMVLAFVLPARGDVWGPGGGSEGIYTPSSGGSGGGPADTDALAEGVTNLYSTNDRILAYVLTGYASGAGTVSASDTILQAFQKLNGNQVLSKATADAALPSASFTAAAVTGKLITGFTSGAGTVSATDTILEAIQKLNGNVALKESVLTVTAPIVRTVNDLSCRAATGSVSGCLSAADWTTFNGKDSVTTATLPIIRTANDYSCRVATGSVSGCLSSTDWTTFNGKQASGNYITALTSDVTASGPGSAAATVAAVGGQTAANVAAGAVLANAATTANTVSTIVKRDSNGDFTSRIHLSDAASTVIPFQSSNRSDTVPRFGYSSGSQGIWLYTDGSIGLKGSSTAYLQVGSGYAQLNFGKLQQLDSSGNVNMIIGGFHWSSSYSSVGNTAGVLTNLFTSTQLYNGNWNTNKAAYRFNCAGTFAATASVDKKITVVMGSTTIFDSGNLAIVAANSWTLDGEMVRTGSNAQKTWTRFSTSDTTNGPAKSKYTAGTETTAANVDFFVKGIGTNASDVVVEMCKVWHDPA